MALLSQDTPDLMKSRLEQGVWLEQIEKSYSAWFAAPNHKKPELLLTGPTLSWAESWMLSQPKELSASLKQYVIRSLAAQSRKSAGERESFENEQRRKDSVYRYLLITMSLFALTVLAPGVVRDLLGFQFDQSIPIIAEDTSDVADGALAGQATPGLVEAGAAPATTSVQPAPVRGPVEGRYVKLARAVQIESDKGNDRLATLLAAEFFESLKEPSPAKHDARMREIARSVVADSFATRTATTDTDERVYDQAGTIGCPDTARFIGISKSHQVRIWERGVEPAGIVTPLRPRQVKSDSIDRACANVVTVSEDYELTVRPLSGGARPVKLGAHEADVVGIGLSGDGSKVVSVSRDATGKIWDTRSGRRVADLRVEETTFAGAALSLDGSRAITWSEEQIAHVWDAGNGRLLGSLKGHQGPITRGEFSADGSRLLTRSTDGTAILWDAKDLSLSTMIRATSGSVLDARLSLDSRYIAFANEAATVQIIDTQSDASIAEISNGKGKIQSFVFSPDSKLLATADWTGGITLWRTETGERLANLNRRSDPIASIMFSRDGKNLTSLTQHGAVVNWSLMNSIDQVQERAKLAGYACLSAEERRQFDIAADNRAWCQATSTPVAPQPSPASGAATAPAPAEVPHPAVSQP